MQATSTPGSKATDRQPSRHQLAQLPPDPGTQILATWPGEEFLFRFGDAIDDHIAEILDELLEERDAARPRRRLSQVLGTVSLIIALAASLLLRHDTFAAWTIWPLAATICIAIAWTRTGKS